MLLARQRRWTPPRRLRRSSGGVRRSGISAAALGTRRRSSQLGWPAPPTTPATRSAVTAACGTRRWWTTRASDVRPDHQAGGRVAVDRDGEDADRAGAGRVRAGGAARAVFPLLPPSAPGAADRESVV